MLFFVKAMQVTCLYICVFLTEVRPQILVERYWMLSHNRELLLGAVKSTRGRGEEKGEEKGGKGEQRETKVQRGDVDGEVKGVGRAAQGKRREEVRSQV